MAAGSLPGFEGLTEKPRHRVLVIRFAQNQGHSALQEVLVQ